MKWNLGQFNFFQFVGINGSIIKIMGKFSVEVGNFLFMNQSIVQSCATDFMPL